MCVLSAMWYFVLVLENRKLCLGRMCGSVPGVGCECIVLCCLGWANGHPVELCADVCSSSVVLIMVIPSCVFGIEVSYYYCIQDVAKLVEIGYVVSWYCG